MYRNGAMGGGAAILAVTGSTAPTATLVVVGAGAALLGALLAWRAVWLRGHGDEAAASGEARQAP